MLLKILLPKSWNELSQKQLFYLLSVMSLGYNDTEIQTLCLCRWCKIKILKCYDKEVDVKVGKHIGTIDIAKFNDALAALNWILTPPSTPVRLERFGRAKAISPLVEELSFEDFLKCENLYYGYVASKSPKCLFDMTKILYKGNAPKKFSDPIALSTFFWWNAVKSTFAKWFPNLFSGAGSSPTSNPGRAAKQSTNAMIRALTDGDITKEPAVLAMPAHRALNELDAKAKEYKDFERNLNEQKKK